MSDSPRTPDPNAVPVPVPPLIPREKEQACRYPRPDRKPATRGWTLDLCSLAVFVVTKRPREHAWPEGNQWQMRTVNRIRATHGTPSAGEEPCKFHYARIARCPDGRWRPVFCTSPGDAVPRFAIGRFYTERGQTGGLVRRGRTAAWARVHNPFWTETHFDSGLALCGAALI